VKIKEILNALVAFFATVVTELLGGWDYALQALVIVIIIDMISGIMKAIHNKEVSSSICLFGCLKKIGYILLVALAVVCDNLFNTGDVVRNLVIYFLIATDGISILENMGEIGLPYPAFLKKILIQLREESNNGEQRELSEIEQMIHDMGQVEEEKEEEEK